MTQVRSHRLAVLATAASLGFILSACGGSSSDPEALSISPVESAAAPGDGIKFAVQGPSDLTVAWAVAESEGGTIDSGGNYTAPLSEGTYHVVARRHSGTGATATVAVHNRSTAGVAVSPHAATLVAGSSVAFTVRLTGLASSEVVWSVAEGSAGGTISSDGVYAAPQTAGTYHVVATSVANASQSDTATLTVTEAPAPTPAPTPTPTPTPVPVPVPVPTPTPVPAQLPSNGTTAWAPTASDAAWVNVNDYGARGDGVTDDTSAFQTAAATGKQVFVPKPGSFYLVTGPISMRNTIAGDGSMPTIKMRGANGDSEHQILRYTDQHFASMAYVQGLTLDGQWNGTTTPGGEYAHGIIIGGTSNLTVRYNSILNAMGDCVMIGGDPGRGGSANPSSGIYVLNNRLDNAYRCNVAVIYASNYWIQNNTINKYNSYVTAIDNEPNSDNVSSDTNGTISDNVFNCPNTACVMLYHFPDGYPASGLAGSNIVVTRNTGVFPSGYGFAQVGNWTNITNSGNAWN